MCFNVDKNLAVFASEGVSLHQPTRFYISETVRIASAFAAIGNKEWLAVISAATRYSI